MISVTKKSILFAVGISFLHSCDSKRANARERNTAFFPVSTELLSVVPRESIMTPWEGKHKSINVLIAILSFDKVVISCTLLRCIVLISAHTIIDPSIKWAIYHCQSCSPVKMSSKITKFWCNSVFGPFQCMQSYGKNQIRANIHKPFIKTNTKIRRLHLQKRE